MNPLLEGIRLRYSEFIALHMPDDRKEYYYSRINSIPDNILDTKLPFMIKQKLRNLDKIVSKIARDIEKEGVNIKPLQDSIQKLADDLKEADKRFMKKLIK